MSWCPDLPPTMATPSRRNGQLMCFVRTLCATCQGTLHALQWLWKMYTAKCQTFIKLLNSFHAGAELLCGCNKNSEKMTLGWMSAEASEKGIIINLKKNKKNLYYSYKVASLSVGCRSLVYERRQHVRAALLFQVDRSRLADRTTVSSHWPSRLITVMQQRSARNKVALFSFSVFHHQPVSRKGQMKWNGFNKSFFLLFDFFFPPLLMLSSGATAFQPNYASN